MSFRVDVTGTAPGINHSHFTALQVKNALIDRQRDLWGQRSSIDLNEPDLCLHVHLHRGEAILSLDGSGGVCTAGDIEPPWVWHRSKKTSRQD